MAKMKELKFRDLTKDDVEVRVQSCGISGNGNNYARLLIYKDARVDMNKYKRRDEHGKNERIKI